MTSPVFLVIGPTGRDSWPSAAALREVAGPLRAPVLRAEADSGWELAGLLRQFWPSGPSEQLIVVGHLALPGLPVLRSLLSCDRGACLGVPRRQGGADGVAAVRYTGEQRAPAWPGSWEERPPVLGRVQVPTVCPWHVHLGSLSLEG